MTARSSARLQILLAAVLFSTGGAAIKASDFTNWQVVGLRCGIAVAALWLLLPAARRVQRGHLGPTCLVACSFAATLVLFVLANKLTTAANTIFLQSTAPLYILLLSPWLLKESFRRMDLYFMAAVAVGMMLFFVSRQSTFATAPDPVSGNSLAALSGVTYAGLLMGLRWMSARGGSPAAVPALGNFLGLLCALPFMFPLGDHGITDWAVVTYLGVFQIGLAYALITRAIPHVPALEASLLLFLEPALSPIIAWLAHGEYPGPLALLGGALIMLATALKTGWDERAKAP